MSMLSPFFPYIKYLFIPFHSYTGPAIIISYWKILVVVKFLF